jgi:hypothetical protein
MRRSTKHAIAQRLLGLFGVALFAGPMWFHGLGFVPPTIQLMGLPILFFAMLSAFGIGPWGRYFKALFVADNEAYIKSLEPKQPWQ